jgi:predicted nucleic acid-binding protein
MTAVLDTNVLVAAAIGRSRDRWPRARWLIDVALIGQRRFEPVTSLELMAELVTVLDD